MGDVSVSCRLDFISSSLFFCYLSVVSYMMGRLQGNASYHVAVYCFVNEPLRERYMGFSALSALDAQVYAD